MEYAALHLKKKHFSTLAKAATPSLYDENNVRKLITFQTMHIFGSSDCMECACTTYNVIVNDYFHQVLNMRVIICCSKIAKIVEEDGKNIRFRWLMEKFETIVKL